MNRPNSSALRVEVPLLDRVVPVEEWDWDEIYRLEDIIRERFSRMPRCTVCTHPMVLAQTYTHHSCRPAPPQKRSELRAR